MSTTRNGNLVIQVAKLEERMESVEEGIQNFRAFHSDVREFITRSDERAKHRAEQEAVEKQERDSLDKRRSRIHFWWLGILSGIILLCFAAGLNYVTSFEKRHHVSEAPVVSSEQPKQHAKEE